MEPAGPGPGRGHPGFPGNTEPTRDRDGQCGVLDKSFGPVYRRPGIQPSSSGQGALCLVPNALCSAREGKPEALEQRTGGWGTRKGNRRNRRSGWIRAAEHQGKHRLSRVRPVFQDGAHGKAKYRELESWAPQGHRYSTAGLVHSRKAEAGRP